MNNMSSNGYPLIINPLSAETDEVSQTKAFIPLNPEYACATDTVLI